MIVDILPNKSKDKGLFLVLTLILVLSWLARDFIFINLDFKLSFFNYPKHGDYSHSFFDFLTPWGYKAVYSLKWIMSAVFVIFTFLLTCIALFLTDRKKEKLKWVIIVYAIILGLSCISFVLGWLIGFLFEGFDIARFFLHIIQSPIPFFMFLIVFHFFTTSSDKKTTE